MDQVEDQAEDKAEIKAEEYQLQDQGSLSNNSFKYTKVRAKNIYRIIK